MRARAIAIAISLLAASGCATGGSWATADASRGVSVRWAADGPPESVWIEWEGPPAGTPRFTPMATPGGRGILIEFGEVPE